MSLIVRIQKNTSDCQICVAVGDTQNSGGKGTLTVLIEGLPSMSRSVDLVYPPQLICFPETPKDGKTHSVKATVVSMNDTNSDFEIIDLC